MFPGLAACEAGDETIDALVDVMRRPDLRAPVGAIPAGFTYLGQFIDHDITFSASGGFVNLRTPRFDLDSLYGAGPVAQPFLYDWDSEPKGVRLLVGDSRGVADLPRNRQGVALVGDPRNDEHAILTQLHLLFIRFHNAVVERLVQSDVPADELFSEAQRIVRDHYRWIVMREFLPLITGAAPAAARAPLEPGEEPFIPLEFSGAAYRFGHSLVRAQYGLRRRVPGAGPVHATPVFPHMAGSTWLARELVIDWERFFPLPGAHEQVQPSQSINPRITGPLFHLPTGEPELPRRTLLFGRKRGLPSGQAVARALGERTLDDEELHLAEVGPAVAADLRRGTPLWFYLLCEAEARAGGRRLGPAGARIVADVFTALFEADREADPDWTPGELGTGGTFGMADLIGFTSVANRN
jgi:Animal haem peroxidase